MSGKAWQRVIRERHASEDNRSPLSGLAGCEVRRITRAEAESVILKYEWLGMMGRAVAMYGLVSPQGELLGAAVFGGPAAVESRDICGKDFRELAVCLERGACTHRAPKNAASFLIAQAVKMAAKDYGWRIFYAYADQEAGEIGTVYQACNWLYIGQGVGRTPGRMREHWRLPEGREVSGRTLRHRKMLRSDALAAGWVLVLKYPKHKYVHLEGNKLERRKFMDALRYEPKTYPKRMPRNELHG